MTERIACSKCGALILLATAARNGGICTPCAEGTRESIEAAKRYHASELELDRTDPQRRLWRELVRHMGETEEGLNVLSPVEKRYVAVVFLDVEVRNGGFDQYFFNSSGSYYCETVEGLLAMGATHTLALLKRAKESVFQSSPVPVDTAKRRRILLQADSESLYKRLDQLDHLYYEDPDVLADKLEAYARKEGLI